MNRLALTAILCVVLSVPSFAQTTGGYGPGGPGQGGGGSATPGGSSGQFQFNNSGAFGGSSLLSQSGGALTAAGALHMGTHTLDGSAIAVTGGTLDGITGGATTPWPSFKTTTPSLPTSITTSQSVASGAGLIPVANPSSLVVGQPVSGTNIPANDYVGQINGGTATITATAVGEPSGGAYVAVTANPTGWFDLMAIQDSTTSGAIGSNSYITNLVGAGAPSGNLTASGTSGQSVLTLSSGGAACLVGQQVFDSTNPTYIPTDTFVYTTGATSIQLNHNLAGSPSSDTINCYPSFFLNTTTTAAVVAGDNLNLSPTFGLDVPTTGTVAAAATLTLGAPVAVMTGSVAAGGPVGFTGQLTMNGAYAGGIMHGNYPAEPGLSNSDVLFGLYAGAALPNTDTLTVAIGHRALANAANPNVESTVVGGEAGYSLVYASYETLFGHGTLANCVGGFVVPGQSGTACTHIVGIGTDTFTHCLTCNNDIAIGSLAGQYSNAYNDIYLGANAGAQSSGNLGLLTAIPHDNLAIGNSTLGGIGNMTSAHYNIAIGNTTLQSVTTGSGNTCVGQDSGSNVTCGNVTTGNSNTVIGEGAGAALSTGGNSVLIGYDAGLTMTTIGANIAIGPSAMGTVCTSCFDNIVMSIGNGTVPTSNTDHYVEIGETFIGTSSIPTIASGFGTSPSVGTGGTSGQFTVTVGSGGTASTGSINFHVNAPHGYACHGVDETSPLVGDLQSVVVSAGQVALTNYDWVASVKTATPWNASDVLRVWCNGG